MSGCEQQYEHGEWKNGLHQLHFALLRSSTNQETARSVLGRESLHVSRPNLDQWTMRTL